MFNRASVTECPCSCTARIESIIYLYGYISRVVCIKQQYRVLVIVARKMVFSFFILVNHCILNHPH